MLKREISSLDGVPAELQGLYEESGSGYALKKIEGIVHEDEISGLKSALDKERTRRKELVEKLSGLPDETTRKLTSEQLQELEQLRAEREERILRDQERKGEYDKALETVTRKNKETIAELQEQLKKEQAARDRDRLGFEAMRHISEAEGVPELLMPVIHERVITREVNGERAFVVTDSSGEVRMTDTGKLMGVADFVSELKDSDVYGMAFKASGKPGTDSPPNRLRTVVPASDPSKMSANQKILAGLNESEM